MGRIIPVIIAVILLCIASAGAEYTPVIFNQTYSTGGSFIVNGTSYSVILGGGNSTGAAIKDGEMLIPFTLGECQTFFDQLLCYPEKDSTKARFTLYDQNAYLTITRDVSAVTKGRVGQPISINITLNNTGRSTAEDIRFIDSFPEGYLLADLDGCKEEGNSIVWSGKLFSGSSISCSYILYAGKSATGYLAGNASYSTITGTTFIDFEKYELVAETPSWVSVSIGTDSVSIGQTVTLRLNLSMNETSNITLKRLEIPLGERFAFSASNYPHLRIDRNSISLNRKLYSNTTTIIDINLTAIAEGTLPLNITTTFEDGTDNELTFNNELSIISTRLPLQIDISSDTSNTLESLVITHFLVTVTNPNPYLDIKTYDVNIRSNLVGFMTGRNTFEISDSQRKTIVFDQFYTPPESNTSTNSWVSAEIIGKDDLLITATGKANKTFQVIPTGDLIITKNLTLTERDGKNITLIQVTINSTYSRRIDHAQIEESLPDHFYTRGSTSAIANILPGAKIVAYTYELVLPYSFTEHEIFSVPTHVDYTYSGGERHATGTIEIDTESVHRHLFPPDEPAKPVEPILPETDPLFEPDPFKKKILTLFIIFDIIVFIIVILYFFGINVARMTALFWHHLITTVKHSRIRKKNEHFQKQVDHITKEEQRILDEEKKVEDMILDLEKRIAKENKILPPSLKKNEALISTLDHKKQSLQERRDELGKKISSLQQADKSLDERQQELQKRKEEILNDNKALAERRAKVIQEMDRQRTQLIDANASLEKMRASKGKIEEDWVHLKKTHLDAIIARIGSIEEKEKEIKKQEEELSQKRKEIEKEEKIVKKIINTESRTQRT